MLGIRASRRVLFPSSCIVICLGSYALLESFFDHFPRWAQVLLGVMIWPGIQLLLLVPAPVGHVTEMAVVGGGSAVIWWVVLVTAIRVGRWFQARSLTTA